MEYIWLLILFDFVFFFYKSGKMVTSLGLESMTLCRSLSYIDCLCWVAWQVDWGCSRHRLEGPGVHRTRAALARWLDLELVQARFFLGCTGQVALAWLELEWAWPGAGWSDLGRLAGVPDASVPGLRVSRILCV